MERRTEAIAVHGTLAQALFVLTLPTLLAQTLQTVGWLGEAYFVQQLGEAATAAVGAVGQVGWVLMVFTMMVSVGATTLSAQRWGANEIDGVRRVVTATLQQALFFGIVAMALWLVKNPIWRWLGIAPKVQQLADLYFSVAVLSFPLMSLAFSLMALYRGIGDMTTPLFANLAAVGTQLFLCAVLVPTQGMVGAALALGISRIAALVVLAERFRQSPLRVATPQWNGWHLKEHRELLALGVPAALQSLFWSLASTVYFAILAHTKESTAALAALTVGLRVEALAFMPGIAFAMVAQTLVGQNIGAGQPERAREGAWQATGWCSLIMGLMGVFFVLAADWLAARFTDDPVTHRYIAAYLRINGIAEPFLGLGMTLSGALRGMGDTLSPAIIGIVSQWLMRLPATYVLCHWFGYDAIAAWWTMSLTTIISGFLTMWVFVRRR